MSVILVLNFIIFINCRFKNLSPLCAQAGLYLVTSPQYSAVVKHFGLQLMEHQVKCNWNKISQEEKVFIKVRIIGQRHQIVNLIINNIFLP